MKKINKLDKMAFKTRRKFNALFKLKVINNYEKYRSLKKVARNHKIDRKTLRKWIQSKQLIQNLKYKYKRSNITSKLKSFYPRMENELFSEIIESRRIGSSIYGRFIQTKALEIAKKLNIQYKISKVELIYLLYL